MDLAEKLSNVVNRYDEINALISSPDCSPEDMVRMNKELSELTPVVEAIKNYTRVEQNFKDAKAMMDDSSLDKEMRDMAEAEYYDLKDKLPAMEREIKILLLPKNEEDEKTRFSKSVLVPAVTKRLCLLPCCLKCISAIRKNRDGNLKFLTLMKTVWAVIRKRLPKSPAKMFFPSSNSSPVLIVSSACL